MEDLDAMKEAMKDNLHLNEKSNFQWGSSDPFVMRFNVNSA